MVIQEHALDTDELETVHLLCLDVKLLRNVALTRGVTINAGWGEFNIHQGNDVIRLSRSEVQELGDLIHRWLGLDYSQHANVCRSC